MAFVPRLSTTSPTQMQGNPWWYSTGNIYYPTWGMPNCTCYTYGRVGEENGYFRTDLPGGNGGQWYPNAVAAGNIPHGYFPQIGGIMCWYDPAGQHDGHVAVVEEIDPSTGVVTTSNSGWQSTYFWLDHLTYGGSFVDEPWLQNRGYVYQGCLYVLEADPPTPHPWRRKKMPIWMMLRYF